MKKRVIISVLALAVFISIGSVLGVGEKANAGADYGTTRNYSGGVSYAYGWTGSSGDECKVFTRLLDVCDTDIATGWAQTKQLTAHVNRLAASDHWVNGSYVGYSQN